MVASLDTYALQKQLETALNAYKATRTSFDQTKDNSQNGVAYGAQKYQLEVPSRSGVSSGDENDVINGIISRMVDQSQASLDNSVAQVELANYALSLAAIKSPINGVLLHQDIKTAQVYATPQSEFLIVDTCLPVFRANVSEDDIQYVQEGTSATVKLSGLESKPITGTVTKIYPERKTLSNGENVYQVDIESADLASVSKYNQSGVALIKNKYENPVELVPSWVVLSGQYVWVKRDGKPQLVKVTLGDKVGDNIEILGGISKEDVIVTDPSSVIQNYTIL